MFILRYDSNNSLKLLVYDMRHYKCVLQTVCTSTLHLWNYRCRQTNIWYDRSLLSGHPKYC